MAQREWLIKHLNKVFTFLQLLAFSSCSSNSVNKEKPVFPPNRLVNVKDTALHQVNGTWFFCGNPFNGYVIQADSNHIIAKLPILNGKPNGVGYEWYKNGKKRYERRYMNGNREGIQEGWYPNGNISFVYFFQNDQYEGEQRNYFESGHIWQCLTYKHGYEEGKQKSWNESGRVVNNFTVKNKKLYGVIGRFDCMSVFKK